MIAYLALEAFLWDVNKGACVRVFWIFMLKSDCLVRGMF